MGRVSTVSDSQHFNSVLLLMCEVVEDYLPYQHKPEHYINPVLKEMTALWAKTKLKIADIIVAAAVSMPKDYGIQNDLLVPIVPLDVVVDSVKDLDEYGEVVLGEAKLRFLPDERYKKMAKSFSGVVDKHLDELSTLIDNSIFEKASKNSPLKVRRLVKGSRPIYSRDTSAIAFPEDLDFSKVAHEMGHWLEDKNPDLRKSARSFYNRRTKGEKLVSMRKAMGGDRRYSLKEKTKVDKFINPFIGKYYDDSTEILGMGLEYMAKAPATLASKDPEMFDFVYRSLRGHPEQSEKYLSPQEVRQQLAQTFESHKADITAKTRQLREKKSNLEKAKLNTAAHRRLSKETDNIGAQLQTLKMNRARALRKQIQTSGVRLTPAKKIARKATVAFATDKNQMYRDIRKTMKDYGYATATISKKALKKAREDTIPKLTTLGTGRGGFTVVKLSKQGMEEVVSSLKWQKGFVDDLSKDVVTRVKKLTKGRYASTFDLRQQVNRTFRIDRDKALAKFHSEVGTTVDRLMKGTVSPLGFQRQMADSIEKNYRKLYQEGKGNTRLQKWEEEFIRRQAKTQEQYLDNFRQYLDSKKAMGEEFTGRVSQRAHLYAERGTAMFEAGHVASLPEDVLLTWDMNPAEHCPTCPAYAAGGPYTKDTLPGFPGEGFHITVCGTNCRCSLGVSDLYVTTIPEPERDLAIKVTKPPPVKPPPIKPPPPKPPPGVGTAKRTGDRTVTFEGKSYQKESYLRAGAKRRTTRYKVIGAPDEEVLFMSRQILPKEVQLAFKGKFVPPPLPPGITRPAKNLVRYKDHTYEMVGPDSYKVTRHSDLKVWSRKELDIPSPVRRTFLQPFVKPPIIKPPLPKVAVRTARDVVAYDNKLYTKTFQGTTRQRGKFIYKEVDAITGKSRILRSVDELPSQVKFEFRKTWSGKVIPKPVVAKKPPTKPVPKPKPVPQHKPTPTITTTKYTPPEEVREEIKRLTGEKKKLQASLKKQSDALVQEKIRIIDKYDTFMEASKDVEYKKICQQRNRLSQDIKVLNKQTKAEIKNLVQANSKGFNIDVTYQGMASDKFEKSVKRGLKEYSKLLDEEFFDSRALYKQGVIARNEGLNVRASALRNRIKLAENESVKTIVHEMGHYLEHSDVRVKNAAMQFLSKRTKGEVSVTMNKAMKSVGYRVDEVTKKDKFIHPYMGKYYMDATEIVSMGMEEMYSNPIRFATKDPGMFDFIYNLCRGII